MRCASSTRNSFHRGGVGTRCLAVGAVGRAVDTTGEAVRASRAAVVARGRALEAGGIGIQAAVTKFELPTQVVGS